MTAAVCPICKSEKIYFSLKACLTPGNERDVYECLDCESFFYFPAPSQEDLSQCYKDSYYTDFFGRYWNEFYKGRRYAGKLSRWKSQGKFLDVGCSIGTLCYGIQKYSGWSASGVEFSSAACVLARKLHGIEVFEGDIFRAPWKQDTFDYILINNVLEHVPGPAEFLIKTVSLLKTGGRMEIVCPNGAVDIAPNRILFKRKRLVLQTAHSGHLFFFSRKALEHLLESGGLKVLSFLNFHFKSALKARGWFPPGSLRKFERVHMPVGQARADKSLTEEIPPLNKNYWNFRIQNAFKIFLPSVSWGYDFKILCEKVDETVQ